MEECGACDQRRSLSHSLISIEAVEVGCLFCPYGLRPIWALTVPPTKHSSSFPPVRYIFNLGPARPPWYKEYMRSWRQHFTGIFRAVKRGGRLALSMASNCPCLKVCPALLLRSPMALPSIFRAAKKAGQLSVYGPQLPSMTLSSASPNCNKGFAPSSAHKRLPLVLHRQAS